MDRKARGVLLLAAKPAARLRLDDDAPAVIQCECPLHRRVDVVRALERSVHRDAAVRAGNGDDPLGLDVQLLLMADTVGALDDEVCLRQARLDIAARDVVRGEGVVGLERVELGREGLGPDPNVVPGGAGSGTVHCGHERDRLGIVVDDICGQDRLVVHHEADDVLARDVGRGQEDDVRPIEAWVTLDPEQAGVWLGGADGHPVPGAGKLKIVRVAGEPGDLRRGIPAGHGLPYHPHFAALFDDPARVGRVMPEMAVVRTWCSLLSFSAGALPQPPDESAVDLALHREDPATPPPQELLPPCPKSILPPSYPPARLLGSGHPVMLSGLSAS